MRRAVIRRAPVATRRCHHRRLCTPTQRPGAQTLKEHGCIRSSFTLESWFCLPEQGMTKYESLSRASLFAVASNVEAGPRWHLLGPAHVTHPWQFMGQFYDEDEHDWLRFVREDAVRKRMTLRSLHDGNVLVEQPLKDRVFRHPSLDLVVLHLEDEAAAQHAFAAAGVPVNGLHLPGFSGPEAWPLQEGVSTNLIGHDKQGSWDDEHGERLIPCALSGTVTHHVNTSDDAGADAAASQQPDGFLVRTQEAESVMGMCGGPVLVRQGTVVGMTAAKVGHVLEHLRATMSPEEAHQADDMVGQTVCIGAASLAAWLRSVEHTLTHELGTAS